MSRSRGRARLVRAVVSALCALTAAVTITPGPAHADPPVPVGDDGEFTVSGAGFGHGIGMSQHGAYGAAASGLTWPDILTFYYPGTARGTRSTTQLIQVWLEGDQDRDLRVRPSAGLRVSDDLGTTYVLPTGSRYRAWRAVRSVREIFKLQYLDSSGSWVTTSHPLSASPRRTWRFTNTAKVVDVRLTDGSSREVRGSVAVFFYGSGTRTVNRLRVETYLRSVVPSEMPTSWPTQAVRAQAVAARTYAFRALAGAGPDPRWDICDSVGCQVYRGHASTTAAGTRTVHETSAGDAAVAATAGRIVTYGGAAALTQFSSSNGGHSARGDFPYLRPQPDPYDALIQPNTWTVTLSAAAIGEAYPAVGDVQELRVLSRDGYGRFGGRVVSIEVTGRAGSATVSGPQFRFATSLRSTLFTIAP